ncbi:MULTISPECIES: hypothetical protein [unclassified Polaromonas]|uniref:hypothetical protein n=1 Tax=unclassified Polaromonas TaxID=2638319 RepID=UPI000F09A180|nr:MULTISPECIES: hypothetical protein [unclassified Polaromonas]AYQ28541.1 hypothetical protein DT070_11225 [Polaromonas sp. SP1]QGJ20343.1 hypothetical protein F7R28_19385 [Polaromonas sp. Pch-P]
MSANSPTPFNGPQLVIPFAASSAEAWLPTMKALPAGGTRNLSQLLKGMKSVRTDVADAHTLSPPHERALAQALGIAGPETADGLIPWAARDAAQHLQAAAETSAGKAWAWITPCHWAMGREHATLTDPAALGLTEAESRTLLAAMQPYFDDDGITIHYVPALGPSRWLAEGEVFRNLPTASLDRVLGRNVDPWLPKQDKNDAHATARKMKLLQNEMQMLLYTHALNDERAGRRQLPVNSFWLSGTGALTSGHVAGSAAPSVPRSLAQAVFADDWEAYAQAWAALDAGEIAALLARQQAGEAVRLTLCGERGATTFETAPQGFAAKFLSLLVPQPAWYLGIQL